MTFSARPITLEDHPNWVAVVDGRHGDMERAAQEAARNLASPQFPTVVVARRSRSVAASFRKNAYRRGAIRGHDKDTTAMNWLIDTLDGKINFLLLQRAAALYPHIDEGDTLSLTSLHSLLGGVSATMSLAHGGTCMVYRPRESFTRVAGGYGHWEYNRQDDTDRPGQIQGVWQAQEGDIVLNKTSDWPEDHLPGVHFSPLLREDLAIKRLIVRGLVSRCSCVPG